MNKLILLLLLVVFLASQSLYIYREKQIAGEWGLALDDSWIHMVFARNLSSGHGYSFNPDDPVSGSTSPLWTLLLSALFVVTGPSVWTAKGLGMALFLFTIVLTYKLARLIWRDERVAILSAVLVAISPFLNWGALSGMEVSLYVALSLWGVYLHLANKGKTGASKYLSTLVLTSAGLARPECFLILIIVWGEALLSESMLGGKTGLGTAIREFLPQFMVFAVLALPYLLFNLTTVNSPFPSSYAAKTGSGGILGELFRGNLRGAIVTATIKPAYMLVLSVATLLSDNPLLSLTFVVGMIGLHKLSCEQGRKDLWLLPFLVILIPLGMGLFGHVKSLGQSHRYAAHLFPLSILIATGGVFSLPKIIRGQWHLSSEGKKVIYLMAVAASAIYLLLTLARPYLLSFVGRLGPLTGLSHLGPTDVQAYFAQVDLFLGYLLASCLLPILLFGLLKGKESFRRNAMVFSFILAILSTLVAAKRDLSYASYYAYNVKNINDLQVKTGKWLRENTPEGAVIAINDIGGIGYFARREIIDLIGMATPDIIPYRSRGESSLIEYFREVRRPDYLVIYPEWFPLIDSMREQFKRVKEFRIQDNTVCIHDRHFVYEVSLGE